MNVIADNDRQWLRANRAVLAGVAVLIAALYLASRHSYLLFHTMVEVIFVVVALSVLIMAWSLRQFLDDDFAVFLGIALGAAAVLHIFHVVDYPGLGAISHNPDPPTQLWVGARLITACSFAIAPFFVGRRLRARVVFVAFLIVDLLVVLSIYWWDIFPATLPRLGHLTEFKKVSEYVISLIFVLAIVLLWRKKEGLQLGAWLLLRAALVMSVVAEIWFSLYHVPATWPNLVGHIFLLLSALLIYQAVVEDSLARPHALVVENLHRAQRLHRRLEKGLLPKLPISHPRLQVVSHYQPGDHELELGGDFIDVLDRGDEGVAVICGDVSGHGPDAAALGVMLRVSWEALVVNGAGAVAIIDSLREVLVRERQHAETYATFCLAWIDPLRSEVRVVSVGHPTPLLTAGGVVKPLDVRPLPPLGTIDLPVDEPETIALPAGWQLFFYTDGLIEGRAAPGSAERFGEDRLVQTLAAAGGERLSEASLASLVTAVGAASGEPFGDDVTIVVVSAAGAPAAGGPAAVPADAADGQLAGATA